MWRWESRWKGRGLWEQISVTKYGSLLFLELVILKSVATVSERWQLFDTMSGSRWTFAGRKCEWTKVVAEFCRNLSGRGSSFMVLHGTDALFCSTKQFCDTSGLNLVTRVLRRVTATAVNDAKKCTQLRSASCKTASRRFLDLTRYQRAR